MPLPQYGALKGDTSIAMNFTNLTGNVDYPETTFLNVLGPAYIPRVYAKDLDALELGSSGKVAVTLHDVHALDIDQTASTTIIQTVPANDMKLQTSNLMTLDANALTFDIQSDMTLSTSGHAYLWGVTGVGIKSTGGDVTLEARSNATTMTMGTDLSVATSGDATVTAKSGALSLTMGVEDAKTIDIQNTASQGVVNFRFSADPAVSPIVTIQGDKMIVNGDMDIKGVLNSIATTQSELHVEDKFVTLSYPGPGSTVVDGSANNNTGLVVYGMPTGATDAEKYGKSIKWYNGSGGVDAMLTRGGIATESYWDLRGGRFQMSSKKSDGSTICFGFRISDVDDLELIKYTVAANGTPAAPKRIAKFGRTL
jgi:hypothetical protein